MPNALTILSTETPVSGRTKTLRYGVALSGAYVQAVRGAATGEVLNLNAATNSPHLPDATFGPAGPKFVGVYNVGSSGYGMSIVPGADSLHPLLKIFSSMGTELAAGAYPAGLTGDLDIVIEATGKNFS